ncbi:hypothetical protein [Deinococcus deserti]|uniref:hypothetical protein n=1 Tax=Deinococcus deserti TaxID=310783 RepID=UPI0003078650|nr:hypothetical protein [Deinococcus deserti]
MCRNPNHAVRHFGVFQALWVPAEELSEFNDALIGNIEVVAFYMSRPHLGSNTGWHERLWHPASQW